MESTQHERATDPNAKAAAEVRAILTDIARKSSEIDVEGVLAHYADDIVTFDCPPPLQFIGKEALRENWHRNVVEMFRAPVEYAYDQVHVTARADFAVARSLMRFEGTTQKGDVLKCTLRCTHVFEKRGGRWLIVHDHVSAPIDYDGKGLMELEP